MELENLGTSELKEIARQAIVLIIIITLVTSPVLFYFI